MDVISNTAEGVVAVGRDQRIISWNPAAEALLGFKAEEVLGKFCYEVIAGRPESEHLSCRKNCFALTEALSQKPVHTCDFLVCTKAGLETWIDLSTFVVSTKPGDSFVLVHLIRDASHHKELEHFVRELGVSLTRLSRFRGARQPSRLRPSSSTAALTRRERDVLGLLAAGNSTATIAKKLVISPSTARNHIQNILAKLGVHSRLDAVLVALHDDRV